MKRYVISPVIGGGLEEENAYRAKVSEVSLTECNASIPVGPPAGAPLYRFALCIISTANYSGVQAVSNLKVLPDYPLDGRLDGMEAETRAAMVQDAQAYDWDGNGLHLSLAAANQDSASYRQFLQALGSQLDPGFQISTFDVREPA